MRRCRSLLSIFMAAAAALAAFGCAAPPKSAKPEPETPAFRYESYTHNEGFRGNFAFQTHDVVTLTPDRKTTNTTFEWTGEILGKVMGKKKTRETIRLDKDVIWQMDIDEKKYREIPIKEMAMQLGLVMAGAGAAAKPKGGEQVDTVYVEECVKCTINSGVKRPGVKKIVNGYESEQVVLTWFRTCKSLESGERDRKLVFTLEIWLAENMKIGPEIDQFNAALAKKSGISAQVANGVGEEFIKRYPMLRDMLLMIGELKGHPILTTLTVEDDQYLKEMEEKRKREAEQEAKSKSETSISGMAMGFVKGKMKERADEKQREEDLKWGNIIFRASWEERNFAKTGIPPSEFDLPDNFKKAEDVAEKKETGPSIKDKPARYVQTACFSKLTEADLGAPIYPGARVARSKPFDEADHNTKYHYTAKDNYNLQFATGDAMEKVVAFYKAKPKFTCKETVKKTASIEYKENLCVQQGSKGATRTLLVNNRPIEMVFESGKNGGAADAKASERIIGFELSAGPPKK